MFGRFSGGSPHSGSPVHRIRTADGQIIYGERQEIDAWRRKLETPPVPEPEDPFDPDSLPPERDPAPMPKGSVSPATSAPTGVIAGRATDQRPTRLWPVAAGLALFLAGLGAGWSMARPSRVVTSLRFAGRALQGLSPDGHIIWSHEFDRDISRVDSSDLPLVDIDGDAAAEWLVPIRFAPQGRPGETSDALYVFTQEGKARWSVRPDLNLSYPDETVSAPWTMTDVALSPVPPRRIWISFAHHTGPSSFVLEVNPEGAATLRYVQHGRIEAMDHWSTPSGGFLAVGGTSAEHERATLVLLPEDDPPATYPSREPQRGRCRPCPPHPPHRVFVFPESELSMVDASRRSRVEAISVVGMSLRVSVSQGSGRAVAFLNPDFSIGPFDFLQDYWSAHKDLERQGRLDHPADHCPDRRSPLIVREWTPNEAWTEWRVMPGGKSGPATLVSSDEHDLVDR